MFNRKLELKFVKDDKREAVETPAMIKERINSKETILEVAKFVVIGTVIVIAANVVLTTAKELIVNTVTD